MGEGGQGRGVEAGTEAAVDLGSLIPFLFAEPPFPQLSKGSRHSYGLEMCST